MTSVTPSWPGFHGTVVSGLGVKVENEENQLLSDKATGNNQRFFYKDSKLSENTPSTPLWPFGLCGDLLGSPSHVFNWCRLQLHVSELAKESSLKEFLSARPLTHSRIHLKSLVFAFKLPNSSYLPEPLNPLHTQLISQVSWPAAPVLGWSSEGPSGFSVAAPKLSNKLPLHVSQAFTLSNLKTLLKTHLFCLASATTWVADSTCTDVLSGVDRLLMYYALLCVCFFIFSILSFRYVCIVSG